MAPKTTKRTTRSAASTASRALTKKQQQEQTTMRVLSAIANRMQFSAQHGASFFGADGVAKRDLYVAAGYEKSLTPAIYYGMYQRNGVARRLVNILPGATWRTGAEVIEDSDPEVVTPFEEAWIRFSMHLRAFDRMRKADRLAQMGAYSVLLIGAPGQLKDELPTMREPEDVKYLKPYSERDLDIEDQDLAGYPFQTAESMANSRVGLPERYTLKRFAGKTGRSQKVHWTRVIHIADETLDDDLYGHPRLAAVMNWIYDLEKVTASGSEAFWQRVTAKLAAKLQPGMTINPDQEQDIEQEIDQVIHGLRRWVRLSGIDLEEIGSSDVANFEKPVDALIGLIVAGYGIPKRILLGSERGELSSNQDRSYWEQQVRDRRAQFAESIVARPLIDRLIAYGALPEPESYELRWPDAQDLDTFDKLSLGETMAKTNQAQGETVYTTNEIRDVAGLDPLDEEDIQPVGDLETALASLRTAKQAMRDAA